MPDLMFESRISLLLSHISTNKSTQRITVRCLLSQNISKPPAQLYLEEKCFSLISSTTLVFVAQLCYKSDQGSCNFSPSLLTAVSPSLQLQSNLLTVTKPACCSNLSLYIYHISAFLCPAPAPAPACWEQRLPPDQRSLLLCLACYLPAITILVILGSIKQSRYQSNWDRSPV